MKIPFDEFCEYLKKNLILAYSNEEEMKDFLNYQNKHFEIMKDLKWGDFENLKKEELERIPIAWLYDWNKITGTFEDTNIIVNLYEKHNIKILAPKEYLNKYDKK